MPILPPTMVQSKLNTRVYDQLTTTTTPPAINGVDFFLTVIQKNFYFKENNQVSQVTIDFLDNDCSTKVGGIYKVISSTSTN